MTVAGHGNVYLSGLGSASAVFIQTLGSGGSSNSTDITISTGNTLAGGSGDSGNIIFSIGTAGGDRGKIKFLNAAVANGSVATTLTSVGPTGASTTVQGWLEFDVDGTTRYIPYW
jgi:hypothetical protein